MENKVEGGSKDVKRSAFRTFVLILAMNILVSAASIYTYDRYFAQKVVAFDIRGYMSDQKKLFYAGKITEDELLKSLDRLDEFLRREPTNFLILNGDAVIKNANFIKQ